MLDEHFNAIVVGSGFGGAVMAYRLAEAGQRVCLLERGQAYAAGSFPRSPYQMKRNVWEPAEGLYGLFKLWSFQGFDSITASGLGGGSLVYASVLMRKDERWFVREDRRQGSYEYWPVTRQDLEPHYDRVERMIGVQQFPWHHYPYNQVPKTRVFNDAAERLGFDWFLPNLGVTFANPDEAPVPGEPIKESRPNIHRTPRATCRLCGECNIGCNYGSKNTLDYTYLTEAQRLGADIRTLCEVRSFEPRTGGGFVVQYVQHDLARTERKTSTATLPRLTLTTDRLILAAGTYGSTFLLLTNRHALPRISPMLGSHFCSNGDLLTFAVRCLEPGPGASEGRPINASRGPVVTSTIRMADREDGGLERGFYIQDGGFPEFVNWMLEVLELPGAFWATRRALLPSTRQPSAFWRVRRAVLRRAAQAVSRRYLNDMGGHVFALLGDRQLSSGLLPLLGMGREVPDGHMHLRGGRLEIASTHASQRYFRSVKSTMASLADALGAVFEDDPLWYLSRVITVHPLGGAPMGRHIAEGVVDSSGQVFNYPGLYVADGSVMPGPVGANPSLTIAALSDRFADAILDHVDSAAA